MNFLFKICLCRSPLADVHGSVQEGVREKTGGVGLSLALRGVLDLAGMLLRCGLEGDARVCGTPRAQQSRALGEPWEKGAGQLGSTTPPCATSYNRCEVHAPRPAPCTIGIGLGLILALCMAKEGWSGLLEPQGWPCLNN